MARRCDLLKNSYLCLLNNTWRRASPSRRHVVICWKIRIFAYWTTPVKPICLVIMWLWFAEKFVSLLIEQHPRERFHPSDGVVICWKIRIFAYWTTPPCRVQGTVRALWFAEKFVSLLIEQHQAIQQAIETASCDLLKNSYLCLLNNTLGCCHLPGYRVVICWKIRIFAYWTTPRCHTYP